jgi:hypothetical protein
MIRRLGLGLTVGIAVAAIGALLSLRLADGDAKWGVLLGEVIAAVSGAFAPTVLDIWQERRAALAGAPQLEDLFEISPAAVLDPRLAVVDFIGRHDELTDLIRWCELEAGSHLRLLTAPGGVGKTRLVRHFALWAAELGWDWRPLDEGEVLETAISRARAATSRPLLLTVDYAEARLGLDGLLRQLSSCSQHDRVRVLLVARSKGEWWNRLIDGASPRVAQLIGDPDVAVEIPTAIDASISEEEIVTAAARDFARHLRRPMPAAVNVTKRTPGPARVLDLHVAALLAVLDGHPGETPEAGTAIPVENVLEMLLQHERRYWTVTADRTAGPRATRPGSPCRRSPAG